MGGGGITTKTSLAGTISGITAGVHEAAPDIIVSISICIQLVAPLHAARVIELPSIRIPAVRATGECNSIRPGLCAAAAVAILMAIHLIYYRIYVIAS